MNIQGIKAYQNALNHFATDQEKITSYVNNTFTAPSETKGFINVLENSLNQVNALQNNKNKAIEDFASGKNNNVHELMIAMQKASTATQLTTAVRNKILEIYKEISTLSF
ncbi:MAG: flagellar hook-basal body complex protein FliE [Desulfovibrionaceae bacterium]